MQRFLMLDNRGWEDIAYKAFQVIRENRNVTPSSASDSLH